MATDKEIDYTQPVAYDTAGRPLYLHPNTEGEKDEGPMAVHIVKSSCPEKPVLSDVVKLRHERSKQLYPQLSLTEGEYILSNLKRHPIGMFWPIAVGTIIVALLIAFLVNFEYISKSLTIGGSTIRYDSILPVIILLIAFTVVVVYVFYYVFSHNRFYLTNESIVQEVQNALFSKYVQTVSLDNVEDTRFSQSSILQQLFNYGTIRLSTIGEEHTYQLTYVANPKEYIARLNSAVEAFKNGRPVDDVD